MNPYSVYLGSVGLNTKIDPVRNRDSGNGMVALSSCTNVEIDDSGRISRRKGFSLVESGNWHSLFSCSEYVLGVKGDGLYCFSGAAAPIRNVSVGARMSYAKAFDGEKEVVYYMNGYESGKVYGSVSYAIGGKSYVGPDTTKSLGDPPIGNHIAVWNGRLFVASGNVLWHSEAFNLEVFDYARGNVVFDGDIVALMPTRSGLGVGTNINVVLLSGTSPAEWSYVELAQYGAIEWTECKSKYRVGEGTDRGAWIFATRNGICTLDNDGVFSNLTEEKISYPSCFRGGSGIFNGKYVVTLEG